MKTIILDMYGVIIKESKGNFIPYTYKRFPLTDKKFLVQSFTKAGLGEINSRQFIESLGFTDWEQTQADYIENYLTFDAEFIDFAETFKDKCNFALLSNDVSEWSEYITNLYGLDKYFQTKIVSGDVGCRKPDRQIFELCLRRLDCPAEQCLFIDNSVKNLITARETGMEVVLFNRDNEEFDGKIVYGFEELKTLTADWIWR